MHQLHQLHQYRRSKCGFLVNHPLTTVLFKSMNSCFSIFLSFLLLFLLAFLKQQVKNVRHIVLVDLINPAPKLWFLCCVSDNSEFWTFQLFQQKLIMYLFCMLECECVKTLSNKIYNGDFILCNFSSFSFELVKMWTQKTKLFKTFAFIFKDKGAY